MDRAQWRQLIQAASALPRHPVGARTFLHLFQTYSRPAVLGCADGKQRVVKGRQVGRAVFNDQVVGRMGALLAAPVPEVGIVEVPPELIRIEPQLAFLPPGPAHSSLVVPDMTDRLTMQYAHHPENRLRMASLAVLYSWAGVWTDHQLIYQKAAPNLVYSVDHGHFFPGGPNWTTASLQGAAPAVMDPFFAQCAFSHADLVAPRAALMAVTATQIAEVIAAPPDDWGVTLEERVVLAEYLAQRREDLLSTI